MRRPKPHCITAEGAAADGRGLLGFCVVLALGVALCVLVIDNQSFWIDEFGTWSYARAVSLTQWYATFVDGPHYAAFIQTPNSDGQLPLYHFLVFAWSRLAGLGEMRLRAVNAVFFIGILVATYSCPALGWAERRLWTASLGLHAFVWAYLDEARPYMMMMLGATVLTTALVAMRRVTCAAQPTSRDVPLARLLLGSIICFGASPISTPFIAGISLAIASLLRRSHLLVVWRAIQDNFLAIILALGVFALTAGFVLHSLMKGDTPDLGHSTNLSTLAFSGIEIMGGGGFVPGRERLRIEGAHAIRAWQWLLLVAEALTVFGLAAWGTYLGDRRVTVALALVCAIAGFLVAMAGYSIGFRVLGRHVTFLVPPLMLLTSYGALRLGSRARWIAIPTLVGLLSVSALLMHFDVEHRNEDLRGAAAVARASHDAGGTVWWVADPRALLQSDIEPTPLSAAEHGVATASAGVVVAGAEKWRDAAARLPVPSLIIVQRPETNDADTFFRRSAERFGLTQIRSLRGVLVYSTPDQTHAPCSNEDRNAQHIDPVKTIQETSC